MVKMATVFLANGQVVNFKSVSEVKLAPSEDAMLNGTCLQFLNSSGEAVGQFTADYIAGYYFPDSTEDPFIQVSYTLPRPQK